MNAPTGKLQKVRSSMMNAVHDLPLLVARDEGFFRDEGLDVEILKTPGSGQHASDHRALRDDIFKRTLEASYEDGQCDQFRMCEWGIMKRAVESNVEAGHRPAKIVALGSAMSSFAIVCDPKSNIYEPEQLKNVPIGVSPFNGSHFTMLKMMEGFVKREEIKWENAGTHRERLDALRAGKVKAVSLQEPWISVAEKQGCRILIEFALDPQRSSRRRTRRPNACEDVPGRGARRGCDQQESREIRALPARGSRWPD